MFTPWVLVLLILATQIAFFAARDALQRAIRQLGSSVSHGLRLFGRWCNATAERMRFNARELLLAAGRLSAERKLERELARLSDGFARELGKYPALHQKLAASTEKLSTDAAASADVPPAIPGWGNAFESATKLPEMPDRATKKILEEIRDGASAAEQRLVREYQKDAAERHKILRGMHPVLKDVKASLDHTLSAVKRTLDLSNHIDAHIEKYEQIKSGDTRALAADAVVTFVISFIVMAVAAGGAMVNFQLIALPMSELVPATTRVAGMPVAQIAALVLVLMEATAGLFVMEALGITELFPRVAQLDVRRRRIILFLALGCLFIFAGIEASLAILREQIVEADLALKASLSGHKELAKPAFSAIPVIGQAVLGFVLPWLLALVALPLEMLIASGRHVCAGVIALMLGFVGVIARVIGRAVQATLNAAGALLDVYIAIPLLIERAIANKKPALPRATTPNADTRVVVRQ